MKGAFIIVVLLFACSGQAQVKRKFISNRNFGADQTYLGSGIGYRLAGNPSKSWSLVEKTYDYGKTWHALDLSSILTDTSMGHVPYPHPMARIHMLHQDTVLIYAAQYVGTMPVSAIRTTDGGLSWHKTSLREFNWPKHFCRCMRFIGEDGWYATGPWNQIQFYTSGDHGKTWNQIAKFHKDNVKGWPSDLDESYQPEILSLHVETISQWEWRIGKYLFETRNAGRVWKHVNTIDVTPEAVDLYGRKPNRMRYDFDKHEGGYRIHNLPLPPEVNKDGHTWTLEQTRSEGITWSVVNHFSQVEDQDDITLSPFKEWIVLKRSYGSDVVLIGDDGTVDKKLVVMHGDDRTPGYWKTHRLEIYGAEPIRGGISTTGQYSIYLMKDQDGAGHIVSSDSYGKSWQDFSVDWPEGARVKHIETHAFDKPWIIKLKVKSKGIHVIWKSADKGKSWTQEVETIEKK